MNNQPALGYTYCCKNNLKPYSIKWKSESALYLVCIEKTENRRSLFILFFAKADWLSTVGFMMDVGKQK